MDVAGQRQLKLVAADAAYTRDPIGSARDAG
jgi:hypothetical protein